VYEIAASATQSANCILPHAYSHRARALSYASTNKNLAYLTS